MIILQSRTRYTFRERAPEWILSFGLILWGIFVLAIPTLFDSGTYKVLLSVMSQEAWGWAPIIIGLFRLMALAINGHWKNSTHLRALGAVGGVTIWASLCLVSLMNLNERGTGVSTFGMLMVFDFLALWWAAGDAKLMDNESAQVIKDVRNG